VETKFTRKPNMNGYSDIHVDVNFNNELQCNSLSLHSRR